MLKNFSKLHAPCCAHPDCNNLVGYHERKIKKDNTISYKWKTFCEKHRTVYKSVRDAFITSKGGCQNKDGMLGWECGNPNVDKYSLTIDHYDGNKHNNDQNNLVVLCANCHNKKTKLFRDSVQEYKNVNQRFYTLFEVIND